VSKVFWLEETQADSRRERRKLEFRDKILEAAIELFQDKGCDATTLDDICRVADVSRPTFYKHYATKHELIFELGTKLWLSVGKELSAASLEKHQTTARFVEAFFETVRKEIAKYGNLERELIRQSMMADPHESKGGHLLNVLTKLFLTAFTQGKKRGEVGNRFPIDFLAEMTMGGVNMVMMSWALDENYPVQKRLKQLADYVNTVLELRS
jgi:AcrR family transcriptional regulator